MKLKFVKNVNKQDKFQLTWNFSCAYFDKTLKSKQEKKNINDLMYLKPCKVLLALFTKQIKWALLNKKI